MPCSGLIVTSYSRSKARKIVEDTICNCYKKYTKWSPFPSELKGKTRLCLCLCLCLCGIIYKSLTPRISMEEQDEICKNLF